MVLKVFLNLDGSDSMKISPALHGYTGNQMQTDKFPWRLQSMFLPFYILRYHFSWRNCRQLFVTSITLLAIALQGLIWALREAGLLI